MGATELILIAIGLAMDAFAVSVGKGLTVDKVTPRHAISAGVWFGGFQALMPIVGYFAGVHFRDTIESFDHWLAFALLSLIGINMIREALDKSEGNEGCEGCEERAFAPRKMFPMAVATSIDALAVGVSFAFLGVNIWLSAATIGITTFLFSFVGVKIGNIFGARYKSGAELTGGIILILIGLKILLEHTVLA